MKRRRKEELESARDFKLTEETRRRRRRQSLRENGWCGMSNVLCEEGRKTLMADVLN